MSKFSDRLTNLRESMNYSKTKMANKIGVSLSTYANWEYGYNDPDMSTLVKLAGILDTTVDYLTGKIDNPNVQSNTASDDLDDVLDDVRSFDGKPFDDHDRELIREILKRIYSTKQ
ncbi:XRE family transcriptional regulator [Lactobacillus helveticus]|uniref:helix-turn-helix domain-containing protein n=1 Tax=Lactobacillus helveticus TaxID=1587 RepID=UPI000D7CC911|nr:helix-turn-helix transcriptional regulator [Lactobacillus helveticus]PXZ24340.1 XRE family transcriptional regulator [Lactobacillus helveticus]PXZ27664.1 XRE family transcriptional regulator [Lactobacillus helveticus]PXZ31467.1 XRE family transcriptional regulator [Lactobacillus helveticus]PXZ36242.1 XRE family transcriptional regulator [Lactobacillus helveticus]PXZ37816.1 XRE family transcriptional regulator [Lactobacillus helveticus]